MRNTFIDTLTGLAKTQEDLFLITGDAGFGVLETFAEQFPDRYLNAGVAEQNMLSVAAGLALTGYKVVAYNIVPFVLYRCYEQVRNDICYQNLPVMLVGVGSGLSYAPGGMTHYSVEDLALTQSLPNLQVFSPADPLEASAVAEHVVGLPGPSFVRLAKRGEPTFHTQALTDITKPQVLNGGERVALLCHGAIVSEAMDASEQLRRAGLQVAVLTCPNVQPLPIESLVDVLSPYQQVVVIEEHFANSGLYARLIQAINARGGVDFACQSLGLPNDAIHEVRDQAGMREHFGIDSKAIVEKVMHL